MSLVVYTSQKKLSELQTTFKLCSGTSVSAFEQVNASGFIS